MRQKKWDWVEDVTGPPMLLQSVKSYNATLGLAHVKILEPGIIFPIDWRYTSQDWKNAGVLHTHDAQDPVVIGLHVGSTSLVIQ